MSPDGRNNGKFGYVHEIDALFCSDKKGLPYFAVTATSLAIHKPPEMRRLFLLSTDITPAQVATFFSELKHLYGLACELIKIPAESLRGFPIRKHITLGTYFRLFAGAALPADVSMIIYLDIDVVVDKSLQRALPQACDDLRRSKHVLAATREQAKPHHLLDRGLVKGDYFQAGVMLINLDKWRATASVQSLVSIVRSHGDVLKWWDQDVLNIAFHNRWLELPSTWNGTPGRRSSETRIFHWAGPEKPWKYERRVPDRRVWEKYRKLTPILGPPPVPLRRVFLRYFAAMTRKIRKRSGKARRNR